MFDALKKWWKDCSDGDDLFHVQHMIPTSKVYGWPWLLKVVVWYDLTKADGSKGKFKSFILFWIIRWYWGNSKCDPTQTRVLWEKEGIGFNALPKPKYPYVMNTACSEGWSFRIHFQSAQNEYWDSMGSI